MPTLRPHRILVPWLVLPVLASPAFCLLVALDAGRLVGLDPSAFTALARGLTLALYMLWLVVTLAGTAAMVVTRRRAVAQPGAGTPATGGVAGHRLTARS